MGQQQLDGVQLRPSPRYWPQGGLNRPRPSTGRPRDAASGDRPNSAVPWTARFSWRPTSACRGARGAWWFHRPKPDERTVVRCRRERRFAPGDARNFSEPVASSPVPVRGVASTSIPAMA
jgi:hypothetical protein